MESSAQIGVYSFDDETIDRFCCDFKQLKIELGFSGYYKDSVRFEKPCCVTIRKWKNAKSKLWDDTKFYEFPEKFGIFDMLLSIEEAGTIIELTVSTVDSRYLEIHIDSPIIEVTELEILEDDQ